MTIELRHNTAKKGKSVSNIFVVNDSEVLTSLQVSGSSVLHFLHLEEVVISNIARIANAVGVTL